MEDAQFEKLLAVLGDINEKLGGIENNLVDIGNAIGQLRKSD